MNVYRTIHEARGALAIDTGFDPFVSGGWGRCTKAKLADAGYSVDPVRWQRERESRERRGLCRECGAPAETQMFCDEHGIGNCGLCEPKFTGLCREHTRYLYECDNGHQWRCTEKQDAENGHKCPKCGEYWV